MKTLSVAEAFAAYEAVRPRLPDAAQGKPAPRRIDTLSDVAEVFDVFLLDAFGVLNIGESPIAGAPERVRFLRAAGKRVLVVSNAASVPASVLLKKYKALGYDFCLQDIVTSRMATIEGLVDAPDILWGVMGLADGIMEDFGRLRSIELEDDIEAYERAEGFLLVGSGEWTVQRQEYLERALASRPRPLRVANPDIIAPRERGLSIEPGYFAHQLAERTDVVPIFYGKPFAKIFDLALASVGSADLSRVVMVGDSLHTDILGAQSVGISSVLISDFGFFADFDVDAAISASGIVPDYIALRP